MTSWPRRFKASRHFGHGNFEAAGSIYQQILAHDPADWMALMMLAHCYEQQDRVPEALTLAEQAVQMLPGNLLALQAAIRLSVASDKHDKAEEYVRRGLSLAEVRDEIPGDSATPRAALLVMRALSYLPGLRGHAIREDLRLLEPGSKAMDLHAWKRWAEDYLAWRGGLPSPSRGAVH